MKIFVILLLSSILLIASSQKENIRVQIIEKIFSGLSTTKNKLILWSDNKIILSKISENKNFKTTEKCINSTFIILEDITALPSECSNKNLFVLDYKLLTLPKSFGSLFWKKGRPNIILLRPNMERESLKASSELDQYVEDKVW